MGSSCYNSLIDVWSAGAIILEMLVGRCVIDGKIEAICKVREGERGGRGSGRDPSPPPRGRRGGGGGSVISRYSVAM